MELLDEKYPGHSTVSLAAIGDTHYGSPTCNVTGLKRYVQQIQDNGWYWISLADLTENALPSSLGDVFKQRMSPEEQIDGIVEILAPIKGQCLGMVKGNHGQRTYKVAGLDPDKRIASMLGVRYFGTTLTGRICIGPTGESTNWKIMAHHLARGGTTPQGKLKALTDMATVWATMDLYIGGHGHADLHTHDYYFDISLAGAGVRPILRRHIRYYSMIGSTLAYVGSYAEDKLYRPAAMCQVVHHLGRYRQRHRAGHPDRYQKQYQREVVML